MRTHRTRRVLCVLGACAVPFGLFAGGYAITGAGATSGAPDQVLAPAGSTATSGGDAIADQQAFYAKLPDRIGILDGTGRPGLGPGSARLEPRRHL